MNYLFKNLRYLNIASWYFAKSNAAEQILFYRSASIFFGSNADYDKRAKQLFRYLSRKILRSLQAGPVLQFFHTIIHLSRSDINRVFLLLLIDQRLKPIIDIVGNVPRLSARISKRIRVSSRPKSHWQMQVR